ncbi:MAG: hypothetical protein L0229_09875, partial [Blastocatellia bacterium]|nr:hypothetical protein [Blastocatellia bacterium]
VRQKLRLTAGGSRWYLYSKLSFHAVCSIFTLFRLSTSQAFRHNLLAEPVAGTACSVWIFHHL